MRPKPNWLCSRLDCQRVVVRAGIHNLCVQADGCKDATGCLWYGWMWPEADWPLRGRLIGKADGLHPTQHDHSCAAARIPKADTCFVATMAAMRLWSPLGRARQYPKGRCQRGYLRHSVVAALQLTGLARFKARRTRLERERAHATKRLARGRHRRPTAGRSLAADATGQSCRAPRCGRGAFPRTGRTPSTRP